MNANSISGDMINFRLRQLGATSIREINSIMHIVRFQLENGFEVAYVFNITKNNKYFLQRMRPYALAHGKMADAESIVAFITEDIAKFRQAQRSSKSDEHPDRRAGGTVPQQQRRRQTADKL